MVNQVPKEIKEILVAGQYDTDKHTIQIVNNIISAMISKVPGNQLIVKADGLYVPPSSPTPPSPKIDSNITFNTPSSFTTGDKLTGTTTLNDKECVGIANVELELSMDNTTSWRYETDVNGVVDLNKLDYTFNTPGTYTLTVNYFGNESYNPSTNSKNITVNPQPTPTSTVLTLKTVDGSLHDVTPDDLGNLCNPTSTTTITIGSKTIEKKDVSSFLFNEKSTLTSIPDNFMNGFINLNNAFTIPDTVKTIGKYFMKDCSLYNQPLVFPNSLVSVGEGVLYGANNNIGPIDIGNLPVSVFKVSDMSFTSTIGNGRGYTVGVGLTGDNKIEFRNTFGFLSRTGYYRKFNII